MEVVIANNQAIKTAADLLKDGHLVAVPTETVYGLAADAMNDRAVALIYETKGRPSFNPLIVHVADLEQAKDFVEFTPLAESLADVFWPGPLTMVLPRRPDSGLSHLVSAGLDTVAIRCPAHPVMHDLIKALGHPLAAPSANPSGRISPTSAGHVWEGFKGGREPFLILDGGVARVGLESTVVDAQGHEAVILRPGGLSLEDIQGVCPARYSSGGHDITSPGMLAKHYAPKHALRMNATALKPGELLLGFGPHLLPGGAFALNLSEAGDLVEAAGNLFGMLHELDGMECKGIAVMPIPETGLGVAINDRLKRAGE